MDQTEYRARLDELWNELCWYEPGSSEHEEALRQIDELQALNTQPGD